MAAVQHARIEQAIVFMRRWYLLWHALYYGLLITITVVTFWQETLSLGASALLLVLTLLLAGWYVPFIVAPPMFWRSRPVRTTGYLALGWLLWFILANSHFPYGAMLFVLYSQICIYLPRLWKLPALLALTVLMLWPPSFPQSIDYGTLLALLGSVFIVAILAILVEKTIDQNYEKDRLLRALEETRLELATAERRAGAAEERQRLGYAIHDTLAQGFTSILMHVSAAESALPDGVDARRHLDQIAQTARENLAEARRLLWALQPEEPGRLPLPEALTHLSQKWSEESGIPASIAIAGPALALRPEIEVTLLRTAQEALANIRKHAGAGRVTLTLSYMDDLVILDVQDDGVGFDPRAQQAQTPLNLDEQIRGGFGLKALRERVGQLGGTVAIESAPGEGTTLAVELPALGICEKAQPTPQQGAAQ